MSANNNTSTLKSYVDSATGAVQNAAGSLFGSTGDEAQGKVKQQKAEAEHDASHAAVKVPGGTLSSTGVAKDDPDRSAGVVEPDGRPYSHAQTLIISRVPQSLKQAGRDQNRAGQEQEARGQINDFTSGVGDRVTGALGSAAAGLTGDRAKQEEYQAKHDTGKTQQRGAEIDIQKQAEARDRS
ncbi:hypothetical protein CHGG_00554 [Chaetomium globosum CBS 148.51]|uniref:CsbD-like domain-containing protein n=1 Tax=Chaetomium globosum (strain ATCC 6205 / CBS 148.51 / DSM 1962 / NBRC 6347 / NRRL 1970) TaxID=306901 RepID=Q2HGV0_CHAGB|nr:uncharacterized protein CHGG_00554 [Chaetomium globosum CBS 148.51]EAQ92319.1 hypothetical protein CHGG_00554 [Chaetomium globosum CBS 148.51]